MCHTFRANLNALRAVRHLESAGHDDSPEIRAALATCWADHASTEQSRPRSTELIARAQRWNHRHPDVVSIGRGLADRWQAEGDLALEEPPNLEKAYQAYRSALIADPKRPWLRRKAEDVRDRRHEGLSP